GEGEDADLAEGQGVRSLEHWIQRRQQRLHHVVQQMAEADRSQHRDRGAAGGTCRAYACCGFVHEISWGEPGGQGWSKRHSAVLWRGIPSLLWRISFGPGRWGRLRELRESGFGPDALIRRQLQQVQLLLRHMEGIVTDDRPRPELEQGAALGGNGPPKRGGQRSA